MQAFSADEIRDLAVSTAGLGFAFAVFLFGAPDRVAFLLSPAIVPAFIVSTVLVALSFLPHEIAHRAVARMQEAYAEYEMWPQGVIIAILSSFLGIVMAAPGGVNVYLKGERYGRTLSELSLGNLGFIALVGPVMNVALALIFLLLEPLISLSFLGQDLLLTGAWINALLGAFNLAPVYPFDGYKVLRWSPLIWLVTTGIAVLLVVVIVL